MARDVRECNGNAATGIAGERGPCDLDRRVGMIASWP
jgi:hypothetical protein